MENGDQKCIAMIHGSRDEEGGRGRVSGREENVKMEEIEEKRFDTNSVRRKSSMTFASGGSSQTKRGRANALTLWVDVGHVDRSALDLHHSIVHEINKIE